MSTSPDASNRSGAKQHPSTSATRPAEILLVEDNRADVRLTQEALRDAKVTNRLHVVGDGELAMAFLLRQPPYQDEPRPDVILLDLNLPKMDGREVLSRVKTDPDLRRIPIIILTTSSDERDVFNSYDHHANGFVTKPVEFSEFTAAMQSLEGFWLTVVTLPPS